MIFLNRFFFVFEKQDTVKMLLTKFTLIYSKLTVLLTFFLCEAIVWYFEKMELRPPDVGRVFNKMSFNT